MIPLTITTNIERTPWEDCRDIGELAAITRIGRLPRGTVQGKSTVTFLIEFKDGRRAMAQTTLALLTAATLAVRNAAAQEGES